MTTEPTIRIGLITDGAPRIKSHGSIHEISNLLIGEGFHWQQLISVKVGGELLPLTPPQGNISLINRIGIEEYIKSVVGSEMNPAAPIEFVKAHAVISRSWAMRKLHETSNRGSGLKTGDGKGSRWISWEESDSHIGFDVCSDDHCQRYQGLQANAEVTERCVEMTRGEVIVDSKGEIADARFSKCCGGKTEIFSSCWADKDFPYLVSVEDPWCNLEDMGSEQRESFLRRILKRYDRVTTGFHDWDLQVTKSEIRDRLKTKYGVDVGDIKGMTPLQRGPSGRITHLQIEGSDATVEIGKELAIRRLLHENCLYSSWFKIEDKGDTFQLRGHGWGHGVGLCQIGAARMAAEGKDYKEILRFYYPGTEIRKM